MKQNGPRLARSIPAKAGTSPITDRPIQKPCDSPFSGCQEAANKADHEREAGLDPLREGKPKLLRRSRDGAAHRRAGVVEKSVRPRRQGGSGEGDCLRRTPLRWPCSFPSLGDRLADAVREDVVEIDVKLDDPA